MGQRVVFPVSENIVGAQPVHRRAARLAGEHGGEAVVDGRIEGDLRIGIVGPHEIILHAVVLVDSKVFRCLFGEFAPVDQLSRCRGNCIGLVDTILLGIVKPAADRERNVDFTSVDSGDHIVIALVAAVGDANVRPADCFQHGRNDILYRPVHIALLVCVAERQIVFEISDVKGRIAVQPLTFSL